MDFFEQVDDYCERASAAFWAEPVNAASNLAFILAAWAIWRMLRPHRSLPKSIAFIVPLATLVGIGSFAFHTVATRWAQVLDVAPIALFVVCYLASFLHWFFQLEWRRCVLGVVAFVGFTASFIALFGDSIPNRSGTYVPVLLLMIVLTVALRISGDENRSRHWTSFATASLVFAAALLARTVDEGVCPRFPLGTHFLWHAFDGLLIFLVSRALVLRWQHVTERAGEAPAHAAEKAGQTQR